jgi:hypothetical protein
LRASTCDRLHSVSSPCRVTVTVLRLHHLRLLLAVLATALKLHLIPKTARVEEGITLEDAVVIIAVGAETTTARLRVATNTAANPSHTLLITILLRMVPHILLLILLSLNGARSMGTPLMDMHKAPTIIPTTPPNHTLLLSIHNSLLMADHKPILIKGHLPQIKPNGTLVDSRLEVIMAEGDHAEAITIVVDQSLH